MKQSLIRSLFVASFIAVCAIGASTSLTGCADMVVPTATFNDKVAIGERGVQVVQTSATLMLRAGKINVAQDQLIQKQVQLAHDSLRLAKTLTDPAQAQAQLESATSIINTLKKQTGN